MLVIVRVMVATAMMMTTMMMMTKTRTRTTRRPVEVEWTRAAFGISGLSSCRP